MIHNIRRFFGRFDLNRKSRHLKRNPRIHNFSTAATAGIIFNCRHEEEFQAVKEFKQFLEGESIRCDVIGYVSAKLIPDHYLIRQGFNFFCQKDLSWYYRPQTVFTDEFMNKKFDILFDFSLQELFPVDYIVRLSPASYKIGRYCDANPYDLMIDIKGNPSVGYFIDQVRRYLSILHTRASVVHSV
jgi:hypothetical protein